MKVLSETEELDIVTGALCNHANLCADIFSADGFLLPAVKAKFDENIKFVKEKYLSCFPLLKITDITLNGSICSYLYSSTSDIDLFSLRKILCRKTRP